MILIALPLVLLAIVAGMMLLAQTKKENLGNLYKYVSWFIIIMGFLCILGIGARAAMRCCQKCMMMKECKMMNDDGYMGRMGCHRMMGCHMGMMGGCGMMMGRDCYDGMGECHEGMGECHEGMGQCHEGMGECHEGMGECHEGMGACKDGKDGGSCPMMNGMTEKKDSTKKK